MPSDRFIAREDDVLDLETGIRYSTADDAEAVADLLNSTPPQHVSGGVEVAARALLARIESENATSVHATGDPLGAIDLEVIEHELSDLAAATKEKS